MTIPELLTDIATKSWFYSKQTINIGENTLQGRTGISQYSFNLIEVVGTATCDKSVTMRVFNEGLKDSFGTLIEEAYWINGEPTQQLPKAD